MIDETFWIYAFPGTTFFLGFVIGIAFMMVRNFEIENNKERKRKQKKCLHPSSFYSGSHPDKKWTCNECGFRHE